jgi:hypothetical protein
LWLLAGFIGAQPVLWLKSKRQLVPKAHVVATADAGDGKAP